MPELDFYFFPGSTHTYLTVWRIERLAEEAGVALRWRPYDLRTIIRESGAGAFFPAGSAKRKNMFRDIERRAEKLGIPFEGEPKHPIDPDQIIFRVALVAASEGWCSAFTKAHYGDWFLDHHPAEDAERMRALLVRLGKDADAVMARIGSPDVQHLQEASAADARRLGLFGSPHFAVGTEVFWGDDRLEDALEWALSKGHAEPRPS